MVQDFVQRTFYFCTDCGKHWFGLTRVRTGKKPSRQAVRVSTLCIECRRKQTAWRQGRR